MNEHVEIAADQVGVEERHAARETWRCRYEGAHRVPIESKIRVVAI